ncbi:MAG: HlyD family efflux transporter periplasmic adaptor subunit [Firmicutes bacterium]|nr:HlyD family efflux transporter periplasmic adaptor subunit [Bacillota bacterium]
MKKSTEVLKRVLKTVVALAVTGGVGYGIYWALSEDINVRCIKIAETEYSDSFTENAYIKSGDSINCVSETDGAVLSVNVKKYQPVKKGDVIAVIDSTGLEFEKQQIQAEINALNAEFEELKQKDSYDKKDIRNSISELDSEEAAIENSRNKARVSNITETSPNTYLNNLKADVDTAQKNVDLANTSVANSEQKVNNKTEHSNLLYNDYTAKKKLYDNGVISKNEYETAQREYEVAASELKDAENELNTNKTALNDAQKALTAAQAAYEDALSRSGENTSDEKYYSYTEKDYDIQMDSVRSKRNSLESQLGNDNTTAAANTLSAQIAEKQAQMDQINDKIARCTVKAQADGTISDLPAENINHVLSGDMLAVIKPNNELRAEADILTNEEPYLNVGDTVKLTQKLKNDKTEYSGTIAEITDYAEKTTSALGNDEYRVKVIITLDDSQNLKDGYELEAEFVTYSTEKGIVVPNSALYKKGDDYFIFKNDNGTAREIPVVLAHRGNINSEIASGVSVSDEIIIDANTKNLADNSEISAEIVK